MYVHDPNAQPAPYLPPAHPGAAAAAFAPPRSAIPKVIGILAIIFCVFGLLGALAMWVGPEDDMRRLDVTKESLGGFGTWMSVSFVFSLALFAVHLTAGIQAVRYAPSAPRWMLIYGVVAIVLVVADIFVSLAAFPDGAGHERRMLREELVMPRIGLAVFALPWPIIALILMNVRPARVSCDPQVF